MAFQNFHPIVKNWFQATFDEPTRVQLDAWEQIHQGHDSLIAAPTGSGKTLAAFLSSINDLVEQGCHSFLEDRIQIVYVSPLRALSNDIEKNLQQPIHGITERLEALGNLHTQIRTFVRTGDTTSAERTKMLKRPPHILVTTPESLYLLVTSQRGREALSDVKTLIVDEIHNLVGSKRGSHLSLTIERLQALNHDKIHRIGLSATQKPIEKVAAFLTGVDQNGMPLPCSIIDTGHARKLDIDIVVPNSSLTAVMDKEVWEELYSKLVQLIQEHNTTLIFVNTRRLAERLSQKISDLMGEEQVAAHHGSMSKDHRLEAEQKLKAGSIKTIVATASLELGIDIGAIDLVVQIGSPRSIAVFLQRVGRAGHQVKAIPKGRLFPLTRDELVESVAIFDSIKRGELDEIIMPEEPLDILAQQLVAEAGNRDIKEADMFAIVKRAFPFRNLTIERFQEILQMLASGFTTRRGRRSAYIHYDKISEEIKGRKGARLTALVSGGAIPDQFDFDVILEPSGTYVGTLNEDFAIESMVGDIFQLGNNSWRILKIESNSGKVRVADAHGQPPSIPFWFGEAPGRTKEVSFSVSRLRQTVSELLEPIDLLTSGDEAIAKGIMAKPIYYLKDHLGLSQVVAEQITEYILLGKAAFGEVPSQQNIVMERFFDEAGDMHVVIHSPFGSRVNKAWGLSLRKRFCKKFNFELQAAATEEAIIMSLGSTHSFPLEEVFHYLNSKTVEGILIQALLDNPIFEIRWRWNASRALAVLRMRPGKKVPPQIQRMQSEDLIALIFPDQLACLENIAGEREVPEHPLVDETLKDCLHEAMDITGLEQLLDQIKNNEVNLIAKDLKEPSPFAQEILNAKPYAFLDPAGLEERRTRAVSSRRWIDAKEASELGQLDSTAIESVKAEAWPQARNEDELYDALVLSGYILEEEGILNHWKELFTELQDKGKATSINTPRGCWWIAADWYPIFEDTLPDNQLEQQLNIPDSILNILTKYTDPIREIIRGRLEVVGPITETEFVENCPFDPSQTTLAIVALEGEGFVMQGQFTPHTTEKEWCERRLLARIHRYTLKKLRKEIEPVTAAQYMNFLFQWHGITSAEDQNGSLSLLKILEQLEGYRAAAAAWESDILPARLHQYDFSWLDQLCLSGKIQWTCSSRPTNSDHAKGPIKSTKLSLIRRKQFAFWNQFFEPQDEEISLSHNTQTCLTYLEQHGACFFDQLVEGTELFVSQVEDSIKELAGNGMITSDSFAGLRALLLPAKFKSKKRRLNDSVFSMESAGRWSILKPTKKSDDHLNDTNLEIIAHQLLKRYGIVFRRLEKLEKLQIPWRSFVRVLRRLEARGTIRGGRFIEGIWGEQFALPEAIPLLRKIRKPAINGKRKPVVINATDPANLTTILTPSLKVSAIQGNRIMFYEGIPIGIKSGDEVIIYSNPTTFSDWELENMLIRKIFPAALRGYLGKVIY